MIPKVIHYCWFGRGKKPKLAYKCIKSWKKYFPDYEIKEWNEDNFNLSMNGYVKYMYKNKKFAHLSDYVRLWVIYTYGGIYFDIDVEVVKSFDDIIGKGAFLGYESESLVNTGAGFGAESANKVIGYLKERYDDLTEDLFKNPINSPKMNTDPLLEHGIPLDGNYFENEDIVIYPKDFFNPYDNNTRTFKDRTENTHSIHWYAKAWMPYKTVIISKMTAPFHRVFGDDCFSNLKKVLKMK